ncbi:MAG: acyl-CoA dehydrogenase family protein [Myxococcota bacterium]|nr:acyl-CoA dehydrogenase family protein [Myxococcota bacterium]
MHVEFTPEQQQLQQELRAYFADLVTDELRDELKDSEGGGPEYTRIYKELAKDGWLGIGWPTEYGGQNRTPIEQYIFAEEVQRVGFPLPFLTLSTVGPTIMRYGSEEQKDFFLPKILAGDIHFAIGYSEPEAGTDLASLKTRAVKQGDEWVIDGQKTWTSLANYADYIWLAARTDPDAKKHRGISIFIVPTSDPGYKCTPIHTVGTLRTNATFYENVRVPESALIGGENNGWSLITGQLNHERVSLFNVGPIQMAFEEVRDWAKETKLPDGRRVIDQSWVKSNLARVHAHVEVLKLMNWKQAWELTHSQLHPAEASSVKVYGSEFNIEGYKWMLEILGDAGLVRAGDPGAVLRGKIERMYRGMLVLTFGGGTNEVQRDIIAMAGLGMPHYKE